MSEPELCPICGCMMNEQNPLPVLTSTGVRLSICNECYDEYANGVYNPEEMGLVLE